VILGAESIAEEEDIIILSGWREWGDSKIGSSAEGVG